MGGQDAVVAALHGVPLFLQKSGDPLGKALGLFELGVMTGFLDDFEPRAGIGPL